MMDSMSTASGSILCHQDANGIDRPSKEHEEKNGSKKYGGIEVKCPQGSRVFLDESNGILRISYLCPLIRNYVVIASGSHLPAFSEKIGLFFI